MLGVGIVYGKKDEEVIAPSRQRVNRPANISEPVISIVKSFKEKGRWKFLDSPDLHKLGYLGTFYSFSVKDTVTDEVYHLASKSQYYCFSGMWRCRAKVFPKNLEAATLPSWMTDQEKDYVVQVFEGVSLRVSERFKAVEDRQRSKDEKQAKVNQDKERQRLMNLYCK